MRKKLKKIVLEGLDKRIQRFVKIDRPDDGWIKVIRNALGMTQKQLAGRLGIAMQSASNLELNEKEYNITLKSLKKVADALECEFHYAIVPKNGTSFKSIKESRAKLKAAEIIKAVDHSMLLEAQRVPNNSKKIKQLTIELLEEDSSDLWD